MKYKLIFLLVLNFQNCSTLFESNSYSKIFRFKLINDKGMYVSEDIYESTREFSKGLMAVKQNGLWGYVDRNGNLKIPFQFTDANRFSGEPPWAGVEFYSTDDENQKRWGYIDINGKTVVKPQFYFASEFINGVSQVATEKVKYRLHSRYEKYFYTRDGKMIYHAGEYGWYSDIKTHHFSEGLLPACQNGLWGFKNLKDQWVILPKYNGIGSFSESLARAWKTNTPLVKDCFYEDPADNSGYWGYIDPLGEEKIPFKFKRAGDFTAGFALVNESIKTLYVPNDSYTYYFINNKGINAFNLNFSLASDFTIDGIAGVGRDKENRLEAKRKYKKFIGNSTYIDTKGNVISLSPEVGTDIFNIYPSETGGVMRITFQKLSDPNNEYSEKSYFTKYYKKDLTEYLTRKFPPTVKKYAGPLDEMSGDFEEGITWEAIQINPL